MITTRLRSRRTDRTSRPAFTVLELALAASIGAFIVLATFGILNALDRTDRTLSNRFRQTSQLERLHMIMQRSFVHLAMSPRPKPADRSAAGRGATPASTPENAPAQPGSGASDPATGATPGGSRLERSNTPAADSKTPPETGGAGSRSRAPERYEPPRVILSIDRDRGTTPMLRRGLPGAGGGVGLTPDSFTPQRLEVVLSKPPIPLPRQRNDRRTLDAFPSGVADVAEDSDDDLASASRLYRGVFEFTPVVPGADPPGGSPRRETLTWAMWWRPLPPPAQAVGATADIEEYDLSPPGLLVSDLTFVRWRFYDDRTQKTEFAAAYVQELPAYIEMEVQTADGVWASWLFEVDFTQANEMSESAEEQDIGAFKARAIKAPPTRGGRAGSDSGGKQPIAPGGTKPRS